MLALLLEGVVRDRLYRQGQALFTRLDAPARAVID